MADPVKEVEAAVEEEVITEPDEQLVDIVQARLDALNGDAVEEVVETEEQTEETEEVVEPTPEEKKAGEETTEEEPTSVAETETKVQTATGDEEEVTLPDAYYRAAIHQGWKPEEIKEFFEANPELAMKTLAKNHEAMNKISNEFARLGRVKPGKGQQIASEANAEKTDADDTLAALKEEYGADSTVVKAFAKLQGEVNAARVQSKPESQQEDAIEIDPAIRGRIDKFFVDPDIKSYVNFYGEGKDAGKLTIEQSNNRYKVLETADSIILGCQHQGREITLEDAMTSAHLLVSEPVREKALRTELTAKIVKRAKGVSLKPSKTKTASPAKSAKLDEKGMEAKVGAGLQKLFK